MTFASGIIATRRMMNPYTISSRRSVATNQVRWWSKVVHSARATRANQSHQRMSSGNVVRGLATSKVSQATSSSDANTVTHGSAMQIQCRRTATTQRSPDSR